MKHASFLLACAAVVLVACESTPSAPEAVSPSPSLDRIRTDQTIPVQFNVENTCIEDPELVQVTGEMRIIQRGFTDESGTRLRIWAATRGTGVGLESEDSYVFGQVLFQTLVQTNDPFTAVAESRSKLVLFRDGPGGDLVVSGHLKTVCDASGCRAEIEDIRTSCVDARQ